MASKYYVYERTSHEDGERIPVKNGSKWHHTMTTCAPSPENFSDKRSRALNQYVKMCIAQKLRNFMAENQSQPEVTMFTK